MLVLIGATPEGKKELVGFQTGVRESAQSWREFLVDLKAARADHRARARDRRRRARLLEGDRGGRRRPPATSAAGYTRPPTCSTSCPSRSSPAGQRQAASDLDGAPTRAPADKAFDHVRRHLPGQVRHGGRLPDQGSRRAARLLRLPAEHWEHLRTTNPIESTFATVRHRTVRTKEPCRRRPPSSWYSNWSMPLPKRGDD